MKNRRFIPLIVYLVVLIAIFTWAKELLNKEVNQIPYSEIVELFQQEQVRSFVVEDDLIELNLYTPYNGETTLVAALAEP